MFLMHKFNIFGYLDVYLFDREKNDSSKFFSNTNSAQYLIVCLF